MNPELSIRTPEPTSIARAAGFNRPQVQRFYSLLRSSYIKLQLRSDAIWNMDETGFHTSASRPPKVISVKGKKQVCIGLTSFTNLFF